LHDPLYKWHYSELDGLKSHKKLGLSCTGLYFFVDWINQHPAKKVVLHRDGKEIRDSLEELGLPAMPEDFYERQLWKVGGWHYDWKAIFEKPREIYEYLLGQPFDEERHNLLKDIHMQPAFENITINAEKTRRLAQEVKACLG